MANSLLSGPWLLYVQILRGYPKKLGGTQILPPFLEKPQELDEKLQENLISTAIGCPLKHLKAFQWRKR